MKINFSHVAATAVGFIIGLYSSIVVIYASQFVLADASLAAMTGARQQMADTINYTWAAYALIAVAELLIVFVYSTLGSATAHGLMRNRSTNILLRIGIVFLWPVVLIVVGVFKLALASDDAGIALAERLHEWVAR